jgi:signal transduction histidine kinase
MFTFGRSMHRKNGVPEAASMQQHRAAARHRWRILVAIAIGVLPLVLLGAANLWRQVQQGEQRVADDRVALARAAALTVSGFVDTSFATVQALALTPTLADPTPRPELSRVLETARQTDASLAVLGLFRADGWNAAIAGLDQPPLTLNVLDRQYVQNARSSGSPIVSSATIPRTTGILTVDLVVPVDFVTGERGVLSGSLALTRLGDQLRALPGSDTVQIIVIDTDGQVVLHPDPNVVRSVTSMRGRPDVDAALLGQTGSRRVTDANGSEDLVAYAPVPAYGWGVLVTQPAATAFALVQRDLLLAIALLGLIVVLVGVIGWVLGGRLQMAYSQLLVAKTQAEGAQAQAESAQKRLAFLAEASRILGSSLEDRTTLSQVTELTVPTLGHRCALALVDTEYGSGTINSEGESLVGLEQDAIELRLLQRLTTEAVGTGHVAKHENCDGTDLAGLGVPLIAGGHVLGAFAWVRASRQVYEESDVSLGIELTQRVALAIQNVELYRASQRAVEDRNEFLSVAAHELKTPITSLRGYAQLALRRLNEGHSSFHDLRQPLQVIELQSGKLTRLIGQLLDISRLDAGRLTLMRERVDLIPVLDALAERTRMISDGHPIILSTPESAEADVDVLRLEQVLTNLLDNAVKYSPHGGDIRLALNISDAKTLRISIQDQGVGIPLEQRDQIFERFYQAHGGLLPAVAGMGLGLYISRQIVELHQGTLVAEYPEQGGVRFVVSIPIHAPTPALPSVGES